MEEAVNEVETTTQPESAPVEQTTDAPVEAPVVESNDTEEKISKVIPYDRFHEVNSKAKQLEEENAYLKAMMERQPQVPGDSPFDEDTAKALDAYVEQKLESKKAADFARRHADELTDPLLSGAVQRLIADANHKGQYVDHEEALNTAKKMLEERIKPQIEQAKNQGIEEGQEVAKKKEQAGAIGQPAKNEPIDESRMSAAEMAKYYNIPRANI